MRQVAFVLCLLLASTVAWSQQEVEEPEVWMCGGPPWVLAEPDAEWDFVKDKLGGIKLYIDALRRTPEEKLRTLASVLKEAGIQVAVECGGTLGFAPIDETNGEVSAGIEIPKLRRWTDVGGELDFLDIDGAVRRIMHPKDKQGFATIEEAVAQLVVYLKAVREVYPDIGFFALTNFPNWGYRGDVSYHARGPERQDWGDYYDVITTIIEMTKEAGVPITGLTCDNPYEYAIGVRKSATLEDPTEVDWLARVRDLEELVEGEGLEFNLICNSEAGGQESAQAFYERTLEFLDTYMEAEGTPRRYVIQSWYPHPKKLVPETEDYTLTALVKAVIERLRSAD